MRTTESNLPICSAHELPLFIDCEGKELGKVNVLELLYTPNKVAQNTELIVCLDVSAGMDKNSLAQAKDVITGFRNDVVHGGWLAVAQLVTFAEGIKYYDMLRDEFGQELSKVEPEGKLNYLTLFKCLKDYIRTAEQTNVCVVVLSSGPNMYGTMQDMELALNGLYEGCSNKLVEFHTVGFGPENDVNLLRILSRIGSGGSYQYCADRTGLTSVFMNLENAINNSGYSAELVSAEGVVTKLLRSYDFGAVFGDSKLANSRVKFRLYGVDSSVLTGAAKYDIVFRTSRGKLAFGLHDAIRKDSGSVSREQALRRIELLYLQCSSYAQQLSKKLPKGVILDHNQQFSKFVHTAKDIYNKIMEFNVHDKRICLFSMIRLFEYLSTYYNYLRKLTNNEELTFADLSILHSFVVFCAVSTERPQSAECAKSSKQQIEKLVIDCELTLSKNATQKTSCLCFAGKNDPFIVDSELFLDTVLFAEDLAKYADLFGLHNIPVFDTRNTLIPLYIDDIHWQTSRERRKLMQCLGECLGDLNIKYNPAYAAKDCLEFSLLAKMIHKMVEMFSSNDPNMVKNLEYEKHYKLLLETCVALLRDDENEIKTLKHIFENYTNPGSDVRLPKHVPNNEVFLMKVFAAFYGKIIPIEKSDNFVERLNLLCLFMFEEEMRRSLRNIPYLNRDYLWKLMNIDPEIYSKKLEEIKKNSAFEKLKKKFGLGRISDIIPAAKLFAVEKSEEIEENEKSEKTEEFEKNEKSEKSEKNEKSEKLEKNEPLSFESILSFNFSNDLQKHIDRFKITEQLRDLMAIHSPSYQFILDFMSMCTGNTISTENNFGICSLAILLQNIIQLNNTERAKAISNSDFAAVKNPEEIGFGTPYMFKAIGKNAANKSIPATVDTYVDMISVGCYDRAQLYLVFLLTQECVGFLDKKSHEFEKTLVKLGEVNESAKLFANCDDFITAVELLDGCKFGSDFSKYLDALLNSTLVGGALALEKLCLLVFGGFFFRGENIAKDQKCEFARLIDDIPNDRRIFVKGRNVFAWKPNKQNIYKVWAKLGHLAPKDWWMQLFSHNKHAVECRYIMQIKEFYTFN